MSDVLDSCPFALAIVSKEGVIIRSNAAWAKTVGVAVGESLIDKLAVGHGLAHQSVEQILRESMNSRVAKTFELKGRPLHVLLSPGVAEACDCYWARIDTGNLEESHYAQIAHEKRMADMAEMTAGIAHEVSNPLTVIAAKATMIKFLPRQFELTPSLQEAIACADQIIVQSQRINKIIKAMRTFARDAESDPLTSADVQHLVEESKALCAEKARVRGVEFRMEQPPIRGLINCRPVEVTQILYNLISNAIDATEQVAHPVVSVTYRESKEFVEILVADNGPGVPAELSHKIFNPFFTTKEVGKGTGLGLSLALRMSRRSGGDLYLDRTINSSCFVLRLARPSKRKVESYDQKVS